MKDAILQRVKSIVLKPLMAALVGCCLIWVPVQAQQGEEPPAPAQAPKTQLVDSSQSSDTKDLSHYLTEGENIPAAPSAPSMDFRAPWDHANQENLGAAERFGLTIGLVAVVLGILSPLVLLVVLIICHYRAKVRVASIQREAIAKVVEAGQEVPLELFQGEEADPARYMRRGFKNVGLGFGLGLFLLFIAGFSVATIGFIPIGIGLAQLAIWKLSAKQG